MKRVYVLSVAYFWLCLPLIVNCANILVLMSVPSTSHFIWIRPVVNQLAKDGHNVTVLSVNTDQAPPENVTYIHLENTFNVLYGNGSKANDIMKRSEENPFEATISFYKFGVLGCIGATTSIGFKTLLAYPDDFKFDLIIYDYTTGPCVLGFLQKFNYPPLISVSGFSIPQFSHHIVGGHKPTSCIPHFTLQYSTDMNFIQRTTNFVVQNFDSLYRQLIFLPRIQRLAQSAFNFNLLDLKSLEKRTQIMLVNSNPILDPAEVLPQNIIPVGGLQVAAPKALPKDIEAFIEQSRSGTVLFAMGTNFKSNMFTRQRQIHFIEAFAELPEYNFLWKFDEKMLPVSSPPNLMTRSWLPQNDILAHRKVKAFITHCGLLSTYEATYHGVPIIGVPVYVDQHRNAERSARAGVGITLNLHTISTESIKEALLNILQNRSFRENMMERSNLLKDQPMHPLQQANWWIHWVMRHPHSTHLRSPMVDLNILTESNLDVVAVLLTIMIAFGLVWIKLTHIISRKLRQSQNTYHKKED